MLKPGRAIRYVIYLLQAKSRYSIHSPFVYEFVTKVLNDTHQFEEFLLTDKAVKRFRHSTKAMEVTDLGASSENNPFRIRYRKIKDIAALSAVSEKIGRLLFRMVRQYQPEYVLELGTSLGISTLYLALANPEAKITTIEGCANTAELAQQSFERCGIKNTELLTGEFGRLLSKVIEKKPRLDFVFIDGDHRKEPTLGYFNTCLEKSHNDTIMVFDDIHWSRGMEQAWKQIKSHPRVTVSIDLYRMGIVFFRKELSREEFVLKMI